jgi:hypothetical protein
MSKSKISADSSEAVKAINELKLHLPNVSLELRERILSLLDFPAELFRLECGPAAMGAGLACSLKPSDSLLDLLAACRATDLHV